MWAPPSLPVRRGAGPNLAHRNAGAEGYGLPRGASRPITRSRDGPDDTAMTTPNARPLVGLIMGSKSDLQYLEPARTLLTELRVPHEVRVVSAHRTPDWMYEYATTAESRGLKVLIAGAGGAAHLPGMVASKTLLPVLGVPVPTTLLAGIDALLSIVQMPKGTPVGTHAIGAPGAVNAAFQAASILALGDPGLRERLHAWRTSRRDEVLAAREL